MKILVACEESQRVCIAFRAKGHEAYSCDILPCSGGRPEWHIKSNVIPLLNGHCSFFTMDGKNHVISSSWDLIIAHPPCTYLSNAGARWLWAEHELNLERYCKGIAAKQFFLSIFFANCSRICVENPIPSRVFELPKYSQVIQPFYFGEPYSKKTCLWLKNLPTLEPTNVLSDFVPFCTSGTYSKTHDSKYIGVPRIGGAAKVRSKTFQGIANAMAEQWNF